MDEPLEDRNRDLEAIKTDIKTVLMEFSNDGTDLEVLECLSRYTKWPSDAANHSAFSAPRAIVHGLHPYDLAAISRHQVDMAALALELRRRLENKEGDDCQTRIKEHMLDFLMNEGGGDLNLLERLSYYKSWPSEAARESAFSSAYPFLSGLPPDAVDAIAGCKVDMAALVLEVVQTIRKQVI